LWYYTAFLKRTFPKISVWYRSFLLFWKTSNTSAAWLHEMHKQFFWPKYHKYRGESGKILQSEKVQLNNNYMINIAKSGIITSFMIILKVCFSRNHSCTVYDSDNFFILIVTINSNLSLLLSVITQVTSL